MVNTTEAIANELLLSTVKRFKGDYSDTRAVRKYWFIQKYLLFSIFNALQLNIEGKSLADHLDTLQGLKLIPASVALFYNSNEATANTFISNCLTVFDPKNNNIPQLYEALLNVELCISRASLSLQIGKSVKDITGSYYTPEALAKSVVEVTFKTLGDIDDVTSIRIADLSCGCGEFYNAVQEHLNHRFEVNHAESAKIFWGIDVDPIALQICICGLLKKAYRKDWAEIIGHFHLGNPLVSTSTEADIATKHDLYALGRLYAPEMGINYSRAQDFKDFDIVIGNPPWEKIRFEERKFFSTVCPKIATLSKKDARHEAISKLEIEWPDVYAWSYDVSEDYANICGAKYIHPYIKLAVSGELNTYALFTELAYNLTNQRGISTLIIKSSIATSPAHKPLMSNFLDAGAIQSLYLFDNRNKIFNIDSRERFCVLTTTHKHSEGFNFAAGLISPEDMGSAETIKISSADIAIINPFTKMIPNVSRTSDIEVLIKVHQAFPLFDEVYPNCHYGRLIHLTSHASQIDVKASNNNVPIYEGKFLEQYDARFSTFSGVTDREKYAAKASARKSTDSEGTKPFPESRYFVHEDLWERYKRQYPEAFSLCWRSLTSPTNARTMLAMILPTCPTSQSIQMLQTERHEDLLMLLGLFNSIPFDYFVRLKMPGIDLTQSVIRQIPVPQLEQYDQIVEFAGVSASLKVHILSHIRFLLKGEPLLMPLFKEINGMTYELTNSSNTASAKKALDRLFANAYQISDSAFKEMLKTFPKY